MNAQTYGPGEIGYGLTVRAQEIEAMRKRMAKTYSPRKVANLAAWIAEAEVSMTRDLAALADR